MVAWLRLLSSNALWSSSLRFIVVLIRCGYRPHSLWLSSSLRLLSLRSSSFVVVAVIVLIRCGYRPHSLRLSSSFVAVIVLIHCGYRPHSLRLLSSFVAVTVESREDVRSGIVCVDASKDGGTVQSQSHRQNSAVGPSRDRGSHALDV
eukprot:1183211-Prorocentrum_minimum.AAC.1